MNYWTARLPVAQSRAVNCTTRVWTTWKAASFGERTLVWTIYWQLTISNSLVTFVINPGSKSFLLFGHYSDGTPDGRF
jgi:hypothetical protein